MHNQSGTLRNLNQNKTMLMSNFVRNGTINHNQMTGFELGFCPRSYSVVLGIENLTNDFRWTNFVERVLVAGQES